MKIRFRALVLALLLIPLLATPAVAAEGRGAAVFGGYWQAFLDYWESAFLRQNGIVMGVLGLGAAALFIITRGKWRK
jgi:hypothetical protein